MGSNIDCDSIVTKSITLRGAVGQPSITLACMGNDAGLWISDPSGKQTAAIYVDNGRPCVGLFGKDTNGGADIAVSVGDDGPYLQVVDRSKPAPEIHIIPLVEVANTYKRLQEEKRRWTESSPFGKSMFSAEVMRWMADQKTAQKAEAAEQQRLMEEQAAREKAEERSNLGDRLAQDRLGREEARRRDPADWNTLPADVRERVESEDYIAAALRKGVPLVDRSDERLDELKRQLNELQRGREGRSKEELAYDCEAANLSLRVAARDVVCELLRLKCLPDAEKLETAVLDACSSLAMFSEANTQVMHVPQKISPDSE